MRKQITLFTLLLLLIGCGSTESTTALSPDQNHTTTKQENNQTTTSSEDNTTLPIQTDSNKSLLTSFHTGFGGSFAYAFSATEENKKIWVSSIDLVMDDNIAYHPTYQKIKNFDALAFGNLQKQLKHTKFLIYWLSEGWQESWFNRAKIQKAMDAGYVPVFVYWYFGDKLLYGLPDSTKQAQYRENNIKLANFLQKLDGQKMVIMEPEFNKQSILKSEENQHKLASILAKAIDTIKTHTKEVLFSLAMTDAGRRGVNQTDLNCGYENCALGDQYAWAKTDIIYNDLIDKLDFISYQEMLGQFSRNPTNPGTWNTPNPIAYSDEQLGIELLAKRINNLTKFLKKRYNKPVFLPYISIATATWDDTNNNKTIEEIEINYEGWEEQANHVYEQLTQEKSTLQESGLFGFAPMALFDNPRHDYGGYQYFMQNEYHIGILKSGAKDEKDIATHGDIQPKGNILKYLFTP